MDKLKMCLLNDLRGISLDEHADLEGFIIRDADSNEALYTAYCAPHGYSSFVAINDIHKGIECADEKPLAIDTPLFTAVSAIKSHHMDHGGPYPIWESGVMWQGGFWKQ